MKTATDTYECKQNHFCHIEVNALKKHMSSEAVYSQVVALNCLCAY